jgi:transcription elongation factor Elf1
MIICNRCNKEDSSILHSPYSYFDVKVGISFGKKKQHLFLFCKNCWNTISEEQFKYVLQYINNFNGIFVCPCARISRHYIHINIKNEFYIILCNKCFKKYFGNYWTNKILKEFK